MGKTFVDLEPELKALIVEKLLRPTDLKNVALASKQLHEIAVKPLYRNVSLDLGGANDTRLTAFCNPRNKGLRHIKQIRLYLANVRDRCNQKQQANFATRMLLEFLPEDTLEEFRLVNTWCPWEPFSTDNLLLLYRKQRKMRWLEVMDLDRNILPELQKSPKLQTDLFSNARKLALYPENQETLDLCHFFVEKTHQVLEDLIIHANFDSHDLRGHSPASTNSIDARELNDSATTPGLISRTIFSHMMPFDKCTPFPKLKALRLHRVNLRYCAETWCNIVNFHELNALRLYQCTGADTLFGQLSKAAHLPKQLKILEFQHKDNTENEALMALDGFLCLVSGIRDLIIDMENVKALPAAAGVAKHGKTLEMLNIHGSQEPNQVANSESDVEELVWDVDDFEKICKACTNLEQLSCAWPSTSLIRTPQAEWHAYEVAALGNLRNLITLHISTFPTNKPSTQLLPRSVYEQLLQGLGHRLFESAKSGTAKSEAARSATDNENTPAQSLQPSKLRLLAFGISDKIYEREDSKNQIIYLRSTAQSALGDTKSYAAPIGWCMRQYIEPRSEVLDFVLHRDSRVPCRERDGPTSWAGDDDEFEIA